LEVELNSDIARTKKRTSFVLLISEFSSYAEVLPAFYICSHQQIVLRLTP